MELMAALLRSGRGEPLGWTDSQQGCCVAGLSQPLGSPTHPQQGGKDGSGTHHSIHRRGAVTHHQEDRTPAKKHTWVVSPLPPSPKLPWAAFCVSGRVRQWSVRKLFGLYSRHLKNISNPALAADLLTWSDSLPENPFFSPAGRSKKDLCFVRNWMWASASVSCLPAPRPLSSNFWICSSNSKQIDRGTESPVYNNQQLS